MVGVVNKEINLVSPSGIIHGHLIVLVRHKQAQMCLQSDPKHYEQFSTKFLKYFIVTHSLTHWCVQSSIAENWLQLKLHSLGGNVLNYVAKKSYTIFNAYVYVLVSYSFSFELSLWWPLLLSTTALKSHARFHTSCQASRIRNNAPQHIAIFPDAIIAA